MVNRVSIVIEQFIVESTQQETFRFIILDHDEDTGARSVRDIFESTCFTTLLTTTEMYFNKDVDTLTEFEFVELNFHGDQKSIWQAFEYVSLPRARRAIRKLGEAYSGTYANNYHDAIQLIKNEFSKRNKKADRIEQEEADRIGRLFEAGLISPDKDDDVEVGTFFGLNKIKHSNSTTLQFMVDGSVVSKFEYFHGNVEHIYMAKGWAQGVYDGYVQNSGSATSWIEWCQTCINFFNEAMEQIENV